MYVCMYIMHMYFEEFYLISLKKNKHLHKMKYS